MNQPNVLEFQVMRQVSATLLGFAAVLLIAVSMALNWSFWSAQATTALNAQIFGAASLAIDIFKAGLPVVIWKVIQTGHWKAAVIATLLFVGCMLFSLLSALGFASTARMTLASDQAEIARRYNAAVSELKDLHARLAADNSARATTVVEQAIAKAKQDRHWLATTSCTEVTTETSRGFCQCQ